MSTVLPFAQTSHNGSGLSSMRSQSPRVGGGFGSNGSAFSTSSGSLKTLLRRASKLPQMDFEQAVWQLSFLCIAPRRVYRTVYWNKQTKNRWARDDPAILVLISACLFVAAILWSVLYAHYGLARTMQTIFRMIFIDFFAFGLVVSTVLWAICNRFMTHASHTHATDQRVEWPYAFDVHANSFFPFFLQLYIAQLLLAPVVTRSNWVCLWVGNTLYLSAFTQYVYVTYLGYNALPFLIRSELLLFPIVIFFAAYIISLLGFNIAKVVLSAHFGS